jgi:hypothetical protein
VAFISRLVNGNTFLTRLLSRTLLETVSGISILACFFWFMIEVVGRGRSQLPPCLIQPHEWFSQRLLLLVHDRIGGRGRREMPSCLIQPHGWLCKAPASSDPRLNFLSPEKELIDRSGGRDRRSKFKTLKLGDLDLRRRIDYGLDYELDYLIEKKINCFCKQP